MRRDIVADTLLAMILMCGVVASCIVSYRAGYHDGEAVCEVELTECNKQWDRCVDKTED